MTYQADSYYGRYPVDPSADAHPFPAAVVAGDLDAIVDLLAPDVVVISPITSRFRFEGRDQVADLFSAVLDTFADITVFEQCGTGDRRAVAWRARIGKHQVEGTDLLRLDEQGKVREIRLFLRPLPGLAAAAATLGPRLARRHSRVRSTVMASMTRPLAFLIQVGEGLATRLVRPAA